MPFIKRKVYIKFHGKNSCTITTPLRTKNIDIDPKKPFILDLETFKTKEGTWKGDLFSSFFVIFEAWRDEPVLATVMAQNCDSDVESVGELDYKGKEKTFSAVVWYEK